MGMLATLAFPHLAITESFWRHGLTANYVEFGKQVNCRFSKNSTCSFFSEVFTILS